MARPLAEQRGLTLTVSHAGEPSAGVLETFSVEETTLDTSR